MNISNLGTRKFGTIATLGDDGKRVGMERRECATWIIEQLESFVASVNNGGHNREVVDVGNLGWA